MIGTTWGHSHEGASKSRSDDCGPFELPSPEPEASRRATLDFRIGSAPGLILLACFSCLGTDPLAEAAAGSTALMSDGESEIECMLILTQHEGEMVISGEVTNRGEEDRRVRYLLEVEHSGLSGRSVTSQGRTVLVVAGSMKEISSNRLKVESGDWCRVRLTIFDPGGSRISRSTLLFTKD